MEFTTGISLTAGMLAGSIWQYSHDGGPPNATEFRLLAEGRIGGYDHPNEQSWRLEGGVLSLFDADGTLTVRFDEVTRNAAGLLLLRGLYRIEPDLNLFLRLEQTRCPTIPLIRTDVAEVLGYSHNDGGISNQKLTLLGLLKAGHDTGKPVVLPHLCIMNQIAESRAPVPFGRVFDIAKIKEFAVSYGIEILDQSPDSFGEGGWDFFDNGCICLGEFPEERQRDQAYRFPIDFFRSLVPLVRGSYLFEKLADDVFRRLGISVAAQFRLEADWKSYAEEKLASLYRDGEEFFPTFQRVVEKILNTFPNLRRIYVASDEAALVVPKAEMQSVCRDRMKVELVWKSDLLREFELAVLTPLDLSLIDYEMALRAPSFVGLSRSTFSNLAAFEKYCRSGLPAASHYIYNTRDARLGRRTDNGLQLDPSSATRIDAPLP